VLHKSDTLELHDCGLSTMMSSSNEADLHDDSLDLDDDKPSRAHASDEGEEINSRFIFIGYSIGPTIHRMGPHSKTTVSEHPPNFEVLSSVRGELTYHALLRYRQCVQSYQPCYRCRQPSRHGTADSVDNMLNKYKLSVN